MVNIVNETAVLTPIYICGNINKIKYLNAEKRKSKIPYTFTENFR